MNQKGFSPVTTILVVVILGIFGGVYFLRNQGIINRTNSVDNIQNTSITTQATDRNTEESKTDFSGNLVFESKSYGDYIYEVSLMDNSTKKVVQQREIDLSKLGWDVVPVEEDHFEDNTLYYDLKTDSILIPLITAPGGIGGNKPEGRLPDPPFYSAIYSTTFKDNANLVKIYSTDDYEARHSSFNQDKQQIYLTEDISNGDNSHEIIWSVDIVNGKIEKVVDVILKPLAESGSIFMDLQIIDNKIRQKIDPNGGSNKSKVVTIDLETRQIKIDDI